MTRISNFFISRFAIAFFISVLWSFCTYAQAADSAAVDEIDTEYVEEIDTDTLSAKTGFDQTAIQPRYPSTQQLKDFASDSDYNYERDAGPPPSNPLARFWNWLMRSISDFFNSPSYEYFWQYVILAAIGALVIWLLYKADFLGSLFSKKAEQDPLAYQAIPENIHELNFNDLIDKAIQQQNYRLAVRLYYLKSLKQLTDKELINWQPTKTNRRYVDELEKTHLKSDFERLTSEFEYVWYGEFAVSEVEFGLLKNQFQDFSKKI